MRHPWNADRSCGLIPASKTTTKRDTSRRIRTLKRGTTARRTSRFRMGCVSHTEEARTFRIDESAERGHREATLISWSSSTLKPRPPGRGFCLPDFRLAFYAAAPISESMLRPAHLKQHRKGLSEAGFVEDLNVAIRRANSRRLSSSCVPARHRSG